MLRLAPCRQISLTLLPGDRVSRAAPFLWAVFVFFKLRRGSSGGRGLSSVGETNASSHHRPEDGGALKGALGLVTSKDGAGWE